MGTLASFLLSAHALGVGACPRWGHTEDKGAAREGGGGYWQNRGHLGGCASRAPSLCRMKKGAYGGKSRSKTNPERHRRTSGMKVDLCVTLKGDLFKWVGPPGMQEEVWQVPKRYLSAPRFRSLGSPCLRSLLLAVTTARPTVGQWPQRPGLKLGGQRGACPAAPDASLSPLKLTTCFLFFAALSYFGLSRAG